MPISPRWHGEVRISSGPRCGQIARPAFFRRGGRLTLCVQSRLRINQFYRTHQIVSFMGADWLKERHGFIMLAFENNVVP